MSECITRVAKIIKVESHPNADRLEMAQVDGWHCVVPKGVYSKNDLCVYIPIDSVLPLQLEETLFDNAKVKLSKGRIKTIKLRGMISQGLIANLDTIKCFLGDHGKHIKLELDTDITSELGILKYEPPAPGFQSFGVKKVRISNPNFTKYKSIENIKNYHTLFKPEDEIIATEKIHGTNFRAGWVLKEIPQGISKKAAFKVACFFSSDYKWEFNVGSHNVQLTLEGNNIYSDIARKHDLKARMKKGEILYGEIYGPGVQKGYHYGLKEGEKELVVFDLKDNGKYADFNCLRERAEKIGARVVPVLYSGPYENCDKEKITEGDSVFAPEQKIREGMVIRSMVEAYNPRVGRKVLKCISPDYLLRGEKSSFH